MEDKEYQLLSELVESNETSFKKLFMNYHDTLFRLICYKVKETDIAKDIIQETFIRVWNNRNKINPNKSFFSYIARISNNLCIDYFRHQKVKNKNQQNIIEYGKSHFYNPETKTDFDMLRSRIRKIANRKLPEKCREIFFLSRIENKKNSEIAQMLGLSKRTVENQLYRALKIIKKILKEKI